MIIPILYIFWLKLATNFLINLEYINTLTRAIWHVILLIFYWVNLFMLTTLIFVDFRYDVVDNPYVLTDRQYRLLFRLFDLLLSANQVIAFERSCKLLHELVSDI